MNFWGWQRGRRAPVGRLECGPGKTCWRLGLAWEQGRWSGVSRLEIAGGAGNGTCADKSEKRGTQ